MLTRVRKEAQLKNPEMLKTSPRVIVAFPALNESRYIGSLVLKAKQYAEEVIVLDDGSSDDTMGIARLAGATVFSHTQNMGKGAAIRDILEEAKKREPDVLVLLDSDGQHNPDEIPLLVKAVVEGDDLVIGSRKSQSEKTPFYRRIGQGVLSHYTGVMSGDSKVADSESGFRAFSSKAIALLALTENGFAIETEMIVQAAEKGLRISEVPISNIYLNDCSTLNPIQHGLGVLSRIVSMISERKPLFFFGLAGIILIVLGMTAGIRVLSLFIENQVLPVGTSILSALFLITGIFSCFTGLILHILTKTLRSCVDTVQRNAQRSRSR